MIPPVNNGNVPGPDPGPSMEPSIEITRIEMSVGHAPNGSGAKILKLDLGMQLFLPLTRRSATDLAKKLTDGGTSIMITSQMPPR